MIRIPNGAVSAALVISALELPPGPALHLLHPDAGQSRFGIAVAVGGEADSDPWLAVGDDGVEDGVAAEGRVDCFEPGDDAQSWSRSASLEGTDPRPYDRFGASLATDGMRLLVGAPGDDRHGASSGRVEIHRRRFGTWQPEAVLFDDRGAAGDEFGGAVAMAGETAVVGAMRANDPALDSGRVVVFEHAEGSWRETAALVAPDAAAGDWFGASVATDGERIVVGAYGDDDLGEKSGAAWVFRREGAAWIPEQKLLPPAAGPRHWFGFSVAIDGGWIMVGAPRADPHGDSSGTVWCFQQDGEAWRLRGRLDPPDPVAGDWFGYALALDGDRLLVGAPGRDGDAEHANAGDVVRFVRNGSRWRRLDRLQPSEAGADRLAGAAVALGQGRVLIGHLRGEDLAPEPGTAWVARWSGSR